MVRPISRSGLHSQTPELERRELISLEVQGTHQPQMSFKENRANFSFSPDANFEIAPQRRSYKKPEQSIQMKTVEQAYKNGGNFVLAER